MKQDTKRAGRKCSVCSHARRVELDKDDGSLARTAKRFGITPSALNRHRKHACVTSVRMVLKSAPRAEANAPTPPVPAQDDPRQIAIETLAALRTKLTSCHPDEVTKIANSITSCARLLSRVSGADITPSQILRSKPWAEVKEALSAALERHPDARRDVIAAMEAVDR